MKTKYNSNDTFKMFKVLKCASTLMQSAKLALGEVHAVLKVAIFIYSFASIYDG